MLATTPNASAMEMTPELTMLTVRPYPLSALFRQRTEDRESRIGYKFWALCQYWKCKESEWSGDRRRCVS